VFTSSQILDNCILLFIHVQHFVSCFSGQCKFSERLLFASQMSEALEHIHKFGMIHRDVAIRNYVLGADCKKVVLIDFGLSFFIQEEKTETEVRINFIMRIFGKIEKLKSVRGCSELRFDDQETPHSFSIRHPLSGLQSLQT